MVYWRCWFRIQTFEILTLKSFFGQIWVEKVKVVLPDNWHTWYLGGADSDSGLRFSKFRPQNPFLGKLGPKKWKLSVLPENWHTWYLGGTDSASRLRLPKFRPQNPFSGNFGPKNSKFFVMSGSWHAEYIEDADSYSDISFLNFQH